MENDIKFFFETYANAINDFDANVLAEKYADTFMFAGLDGVQSVKKEDFLKMLPKRKGFFSSIGLEKTSLISIEETQLYESYILVKVGWNFHYEKNGKIIDDKGFATYILFQKENLYKIVFQLDAQDLMTRVKGLGLL